VERFDLAEDTTSHLSVRSLLLSKSFLAKMEGEKAFYVQCTGQIESGDFGSVDDIYCRYAFHFGHDWTISAVSMVARHMKSLLCLRVCCAFYSWKRKYFHVVQIEQLPKTRWL